MDEALVTDIDQNEACRTRSASEIDLAGACNHAFAAQVGVVSQSKQSRRKGKEEVQQYKQRRVMDTWHNVSCNGGSVLEDVKHGHIRERESKLFDFEIGSAETGLRVVLYQDDPRGEHWLECRLWAPSTPDSHDCQVKCTTRYGGRGCGCFEMSRLELKPAKYRLEVLLQSGPEGLEVGVHGVSFELRIQRARQVIPLHNGIVASGSFQQVDNAASGLPQGLRSHVYSVPHGRDIGSLRIELTKSHGEDLAMHLQGFAADGSYIRELIGKTSSDVALGDNLQLHERNGVPQTISFFRERGQCGLGDFHEGTIFLVVTCKGEGSSRYRLQFRAMVVAMSSIEETLPAP